MDPNQTAPEGGAIEVLKEQSDLAGLTLFNIAILFASFGHTTSWKTLVVQILG